MADDEKSADGNWWEGWMQTAKDKSAEVMSFVKKDLQEFATVVQTDTAAAMATTANTVRHHMDTAGSTSGGLKSGVADLLGKVANSMYVPPDDDGEVILKVKKKKHGAVSEMFNRAEARVHALQVDPETYLTPLDDSETLAKWDDNFNVDNNKSQISELLVSHPEIRSIYAQCVPARMSHGEFWRRYFFRRWLVSQDEERRAALKQRADDMMAASTCTEDGAGDGGSNWDDDEEWSVVEVKGDDSRESSAPPLEDRMENLTETLENTRLTDMPDASPDKDQSPTKDKVSIIEEETTKEVAERKTSSTDKELSAEKKESSMEKKESSVEKKESSVGQNESKCVEKKETSVEKKESSVEKKESSVEKKESSAEKKESSVEKKESSVEKKDSSVEDTKSEAEKKDSSVESRESSPEVATVSSEDLVHVEPELDIESIATESLSGEALVPHEQSDIVMVTDEGSSQEGSNKESSSLGEDWDTAACDIDSAASDKKSPDSDPAKKGKTPDSEDWEDWE